MSQVADQIHRQVGMNPLPRSHERLLTQPEYSADVEKRGSYGVDHHTEVNLIYRRAIIKKPDVGVSGGEAAHIYRSSFSKFIHYAGEGDSKGTR